MGSYTYHPTRKHAVTRAGTRAFTYDANGNILTRNAGPGTVTTRYITRDHLGNVYAVLASTAAVLNRESFNAWGARRSATGWTGAPGSTEWAATAEFREENPARAAAPTQVPQGKCWNGRQGNAGDFLSGLARQVGNDLSSLLNNLGALLTAGDADSATGAAADTLALNLFGSNNTNAGIFGSDLAPGAELAGCT